MSLIRLFCCLFAFTLLAACSGTYRSYLDMIQYAITPGKDGVLTFGQLQAAPHDYLYVRYGDRPQAALGLMFIENNQLKWVTADNVMLVTEQGRIVKTLGLGNDLIFISNLVNDPLKQPPNSSAVWQRATDWQSGEYGYAMRSTFTVVPDQQLRFFDQTMSVTLLTETVNLLDTPPYWRFDGTWQNSYWINNANGQVVKTVQKLAPGLDTFEMIYISEVVRHFTLQGIVISEDAL